MGTIHQVPKKLEVGMKVVVWIKPEYTLFASEISAGIVEGKWLKGVVTRVTKGGSIALEINGQSISTVVPGLVIVRSTAIADNLSEASKQKALRYKVARQRKNIEARNTN